MTSIIKKCIYQFGINFYFLQWKCLQLYYGYVGMTYLKVLQTFLYFATTRGNG